MRHKVITLLMITLIGVLAFTPAGNTFSQDIVFLDGFESPIRLKIGTFNTLTAFKGSLIDNRYVANPANVTTTINTFNSLELDIVGLQEVQDYSALQNLAAGTGLNLAAAKTNVFWIFPTAVLSSLPIKSRASYNTDGKVRLMNEAEVEMPDGTIVYVFSTHITWESWSRVHVQINSDIISRRAGSHPVLVFGDMNGQTSRLIELSRGALNVIYDVDIDAIIGTAHFQGQGDGTNHGTLGFSDHPLLTTEVFYTPATDAQTSVPSIRHTMQPNSSWTAGVSIAPDTSVLEGITVTLLPERGQLKLGTNPVELDDTIPAISLHALVYETGADSIGKDYWTFNIVEKSPPTVQVPRFVDIFIQSKVDEIRFGQYTDESPDTTAGEGFYDLAYANVGEFIYPHDDRGHTNYDTFNESLPDELKGQLFIMNGGRNESWWGREYMRFNLQQPSQVYVALGHRGDGSGRDLPGWTEQWSGVSFNAGNSIPYDIFTKCLDSGEVLLTGNETHNQYVNVEENMVIFIGGSCETPEPGCDNIHGNWATEARDCAREDCSDGRWHSWDGKQWCRSLIVQDGEDWTIARDPSKGNFRFWSDWGAGDLNDCGDGEATISIPECGLNEVVLRNGTEQQHNCDISALDTITIVKEKGACEYVIIGDPYFD